ncbi:MAG: hypothetical protein U9R64_04165, partial [Pseudomonadota bacterium]|nr:hypothetical protein [Pseudomonadota bacterium]
MVAMMQFLSLSDRAHRGLDGDHEAGDGRRRSVSPQRSGGRQAPVFLDDVDAPPSRTFMAGWAKSLFEQELCMSALLTVGFDIAKNVF